jgi:hypothetical protein
VHQISGWLVAAAACARSRGVKSLSWVSSENQSNLADFWVNFQAVWEVKLSCSVSPRPMPQDPNGPRVRAGSRPKMPRKLSVPRAAALGGRLFWEVRPEIWPLFQLDLTWGRRPISGQIWDDDRPGWRSTTVQTVNTTPQGHSGRQYPMAVVWPPEAQWSPRNSTTTSSRSSSRPHDLTKNVLSWRKLSTRGAGMPYRRSPVINRGEPARGQDTAHGGRGGQQGRYLRSVGVDVYDLSGSCKSPPKPVFGANGASGIHMGGKGCGADVAV